MSILNQKKNHFNELFDITELQKIQDSFADLTGLASVITSLEGEALTKPSNFCDLCNIIRKTDKGLMNCVKSGVYLAQMSLHSEGVHIQPCLSAGLLDGGISIVVDGVHVANWIIGQVKSDEIDLAKILDYAETIGADKDEITKAYKHVTEMSHEKFKSIHTFLGKTISILTDKASYEYKLKLENKKNSDLNFRIAEIEDISKNRINNINQGVIICTPSGEIIFHNAVIMRMFSFLKNSLNGGVVKDYKFDLCNKAGKKLDFKEYPVNIISETLLPIENELYGVNIKGYETLWLKLTGMPVFSQNKDLCEIIFSIEDITVEKINNDNFINTIQFLEKTQRIASVGTFTAQINENKWYGSKLLYEILGLEEQLIKKHDDWIGLIHPDFKTIFFESVNQAIDTNQLTYSCTYKIFRKSDNEERWVCSNGSIIRDSTGKAEMVFGTLQDITELKNVEEAAQRNEEKYRQILENVLDVYYKVDMNFRFCEISPSIKYYSNIKPEQLIGEKFNAFFKSSHTESEFFKLILKNKKIRDYFVEITTNDSTVVPVSISASLAYDKQGNPIFIEGFARDISERMAMENRLVESEQKFRSYIEFSPHAVIVSDNDGKSVEVNISASRITGYTVDELLSMNKIQLIDDSSTEKYLNHNARVRKFGLASDEFTIKSKTGEIKHVQVDTVRLPNRQYIGFVSDISYHYKIEDKLRQKREYLEAAQKIARVGNAYIDFEKGEWESSAMLDEIIGIDSEFKKRIDSWLSIIHPDSIGELKDYFLNEVLPQQLIIDKEFKIIRVNDQGERWLHVIGKTEFCDNRIKSLTFTLQDITERKEWTDILYQNEALYRTTINASPDVIVVVDLQGKVKMISPAASQMYGSNNLDLIVGQPITNFIAEEDFPRLHENLGLMFERYLGTIEYKMKRANGKLFPTEVNGDVIRDSKGKPTDLVFIIRDITQRKKAEEALAKSKLQIKEFAGHLQSIREEEKIALAREIHDDLGQILVALKIDMGLLKKKLTNPDNPISIEFIDAEMTRMLDFTSRTIATARRIMADLRSENVNNLGFVESAKMYIENFNERFQIDCRFENNIEQVVFSQKQTVALYRILQESLNNVVKHAKATSVKVKLTKSLNILTLQISDNGCGFDHNSPRRINSFGLLGMKERVALLGGNLDIQSQTGKGTTICVEIPEGDN